MQHAIYEHYRAIHPLDETICTKNRMIRDRGLFERLEQKNMHLINFKEHDELCVMCN